MELLLANKYTVFTADESAFLLTGKIRQREPFLFFRYGDGALECMAGKQSHTRDGEYYSPRLSVELRSAWDAVIHGQNVYVGDWLSASFDARSEHSRYAEQYAELIGDAVPNWLHFESLLLMRESRQLLDFYRAVKLDTRRKVFMGPAGNAGAAKMLGAQHLVTPMTGDLLKFFDDARLKLHDQEFDILLWGAGMAGFIPVAECWAKHPERTYINLGSAMDPLFRGWTRRQQIYPQKARAFFKELL